jgi:hypothetical protein
MAMSSGSSATHARIGVPNFGKLRARSPPEAIASR